MAQYSAKKHAGGAFWTVVHDDVVFEVFIEDATQERAKRLAEYLNNNRRHPPWFGGGLNSPDGAARKVLNAADTETGIRWAQFFLDRGLFERE